MKPLRCLHPGDVPPRRRSRWSGYLVGVALLAGADLAVLAYVAKGICW